MKRLVLALAAAALGAGCHSAPPPPPPTGAVDLGWSFVRVKDDGSTVTYGCVVNVPNFGNVVNVDEVIVSFPSGDVRVPCADAQGDGAAIAGIDPGTQTIVLTARRNGIALYNAQQTITVFVNAVTQEHGLQLFGIPDDLDVNAEFWNQLGTAQSFATCADAGVTQLTYVIVDSMNTTVAQGQVPCPAASPPGALFHGSAALDRDTYVIRMQAFPGAPAAGTETDDSATTAVAPTCDGQAFNHFGSNVLGNGWPVRLFDVTHNPTVCTGF